MSLPSMITQIETTIHRVSFCAFTSWAVFSNEVGPVSVLPAKQE